MLVILNNYYSTQLLEELEIIPFWNQILNTSKLFDKILQSQSVKIVNYYMSFEMLIK